MAKKTAASETCCMCPHHKWSKGLALVVAGGVMLFTGSWGWTIVSLGAMKILSGFCNCCACY